MTSKIASNKAGSFALLNGDEAVARGAVEANVKVAASYPGTPATRRHSHPAYASEAPGFG